MKFARCENLSVLQFTADICVELVSARRCGLSAERAICVQSSCCMTYRQETTSAIQPRKDKMVGPSGGTLQY